MARVYSRGKRKCSAVAFPFSLPAWRGELETDNRRTSFLSRKRNSLSRSAETAMDPFCATRVPRFCPLSPFDTRPGGRRSAFRSLLTRRSTPLPAHPLVANIVAQRHTTRFRITSKSEDRSIAPPLLGSRSCHSLGGILAFQSATQKQSTRHQFTSPLFVLEFPLETENSLVAPFAVARIGNQTPVSSLPPPLEFPQTPSFPHPTHSLSLFFPLPLSFLPSPR